MGKSGAPGTCWEGAAGAAGSCATACSCTRTQAGAATCVRPPACAQKSSAGRLRRALAVCSSTTWLGAALCSRSANRSKPNPCAYSHHQLTLFHACAQHTSAPFAMRHMSRGSFGIHAELTSCQDPPQSFSLRITRREVGGKRQDQENSTLIQPQVLMTRGMLAWRAACQVSSSCTASL